MSTSTLPAPQKRAPHPAEPKRSPSIVVIRQSDSTGDYRHFANSLVEKLRKRYGPERIAYHVVSDGSSEFHAYQAVREGRLIIVLADFLSMDRFCDLVGRLGGGLQPFYAFMHKAPVISGQQKQVLATSIAFSSGRGHEMAYESEADILTQLEPIITRLIAGH